MNFEQIKKFSPELKQIANKHGIKSIQVFGSVARGNETLESDVDFLLEMQEGASLFGAAGFAFEVEKLLGVRVDIVPASVLPNITDRKFAESIQKEALPL